jgi:molecular chaperone GrpE
MEHKKKNEPEEPNTIPNEQAGDAATFADKAAEASTQAAQNGESQENENKDAEGAIDTVDDLKQQLEAQSDRYLRLIAEFDNFKKRVSRDYERLVESANERLIGELLEVRENFERALKTGDQAAESGSIFEGMKLIFTKFDAVLTKNGLEPFAAADEPFDPQLHDALMKVPSDSIAEDRITEVFEKGYKLKNRVIRHAKVVVSSGAPKPSTPDDKGKTTEK